MNFAREQHTVCVASPLGRNRIKIRIVATVDLLKREYICHFKRNAFQSIIRKFDHF